MFKHLVRQLTQDGIIAATDAIVNENAEELAGGFVEGLNDPKKQHTGKPAADADAGLPVCLPAAAAQAVDAVA